MPTAEQTTPSRRRIINEQPAYALPPRAAFPAEEHLEVIIANLEDITQGDGVSSRAAELARDLWEMQGILLRRRFGDPDRVGSVPEPDPAMTQRLHTLERLLASLRRRAADGYAVQQSMTRHGASARMDTDALIILLDCSARVVRALREACLQARATGTADTEVN